jgi:uncharacterized SAM-binding protein YcdF (DUF218 family)
MILVNVRRRNSGAPGRRRRRRATLVTVAVLFVAWVAVTARLFVWPSLPPLPPHVDAIVELGGPGDRDAVALRLARDHRAQYVVQSTVDSDVAADRCLPPVSDVTVLCFHPEPNTTRGEAQSIQRLATQYGWKSVILVTTPDQAWRARVRVTRCFDGDVAVSTAPLPLVDWLWQIPYQWAATIKAFTVERSC